MGITKPTSGSIKVFGSSVATNREEILAKTGALIESPAYYGNLSAFENLRIVALMKKASVESIASLLDTVGLGQTGKKKVKTFSQGMKQRLGIAQALLGKPKLLILDEPINGMDPMGVIEIREMLRAIRTEHKTTILVSSHILSELDLLADEIILINRGSIIYSGSLEALKEEHGTENLEDAYRLLISGRQVV
jgi:ABC-2 type transport system ATP-binding protein